MALLPIGQYKARLEMNNPPIQKSPDKGTVFYDVTGVVTEDGEHKGQRVAGQLFMPAGADETKVKVRKRSIDALLQAGATFPNSNLRDFTGVGTKEVLIVVEHEEFLPKDTRTEADKVAGVAAPTMVKRARIQWVNALNRGAGYGKALEKADEALFDMPEMKATLEDVRKHGTRDTGTGSNGERVDGSTLKTKSGEEVF